MNPNLLGIDRLAALENGDALRGFWVGKVVDDGADDAQGRITARIEALFGDAKKGIADADLPKLQMMPSCGLYVRPQKDDFVTVIFQGSIYEGFYVGHTVNAKSKSLNGDMVFGGKLNEEFMLNFHNSYIRGKYDGSELEVNVKKGETTIKVDADGALSITTEKGCINITAEQDVTLACGGNVNMVGDKGTEIGGGLGGVTINHPKVAPNSSGPFCALPACLFTGAPHTGNKAI